MSYHRFLKVLKVEKSLREKDHSYIFGIFLNATGEYLGNIDILNVMRGRYQTALLGIDLFNAHWGLGIGKEVGKALPRIIFQKLGLHRVEGNIESKNRRSVSLANAVGLGREGFKWKRIP